jgi:heat shock protein HtpX
MAANLYTQQDRNVLRTWLLMLVFLVLIIALGWFLSYYYNSPLILYIAVLFAIIMNFSSYWFSDKVVLKLTGAKTVKREEYFDLYNSVENLSITAGLPMSKVYVINDSAPNAFATGRDKKHAVIVVTSGLLNILDKSELEGVIAHELSHIGNRDILLQTIVVMLVGFITILSDFFLRSHIFGGSRDNDNKVGSIILILGIVLMILSPVIATMVALRDRVLLLECLPLIHRLIRELLL